MRQGSADLPLHHGKAPVWLFRRMVELSRHIVELIVIEHGRNVFLEKLSDPFWFQALGCVLGFDWHSSGLTTTVCGALKEAMRDRGRELGIFVVGGKGKSALKTPQELDRVGEITGLEVERYKDISRLVAKVDNALLQDGYTLYHHAMFLTEDGTWAVIQQGMNEEKGYARRYHWLSGKESLVEEPHSGISSQRVHRKVFLNLTARDSSDSRRAILRLLTHGGLSRELGKLKKLRLPRRHYIRNEDLNSRKLQETLRRIQDTELKSFEDLLKVRGIGPKTVRALAFVSELVYGAEPSFEDPARFSFAHGGKDGHPYPVELKVYDATIETLKKAIEKSRIGNREKVEAIKKLSRILSD